MNDSQRGRVLVVEDDGLVADMVKNLMTGQGFEVVGVARDGRAALDAVTRLEPDVVLMDLQMPEMDGIEATRRIQEIRPTAVVVLTAHDDLGLTTAAAEAGVGAYLVKPPNERELLRAVTVARARFEEAQALNAEKEALRVQNRDLGAFAHVVAHDLKNAVQPIVGVAQLLREDLSSMPVERAERHLDLIAGDGKRLGRIVDDLLLLAEVRDRDLAFQRLDMAGVVAEARSRLSHVIEEWEAEIQLPESWPSALGYAPWVVEIWINYLSNAVKYGGLPPRIELGWGPNTSSYCRFWVRDNGRGLTPEEQSQLFSPYAQINPTAAEGHGLGLSIVRRIVEKLGGDVGVESVVGRGSTFWFTLLADSGIEEQETQEPKHEAFRL